MEVRHTKRNRILCRRPLQKVLHTSHAYQHSILVRGTTIQLLQILCRRVAIREGSLPLKTVQDAIIDLLNDQPYQQHQLPHQNQTDHPGTLLANSNDTIVLPLPIATRPKTPDRELRPRKHGSYANQFRRISNTSILTGFRTQDKS